jgi:hypothetical protein
VRDTGLNQWQAATRARADRVAARRIRFPMVLGGCFHLGIDKAAGHAGDDQRPHQTGAVAHPNREVRDALAFVLVNLPPCAGCPVPATVRRPSAVELLTAFISQHNQRYDLHVYRTANTANFGKRPGGATRFSMRTSQLARLLRLTALATRRNRSSTRWPRWWLTGCVEVPADALRTDRPPMLTVSTERAGAG